MVALAAVKTHASQVFCFGMKQQLGAIIRSAPGLAKPHDFANKPGR